MTTVVFRTTVFMEFCRTTQHSGWLTSDNQPIVKAINKALVTCNWLGALQQTCFWSDEYQSPISIISFALYLSHLAVKNYYSKKSTAVLLNILFLNSIFSLSRSKYRAEIQCNLSKMFEIWDVILPLGIWVPPDSIMIIAELF